MSELNTAREVFFVQLLGEMAALVERLEALPALLRESDQELRAASHRLADQIASAEERMAGASQRVKTLAAQQIAAQTEAAARGVAHTQVLAMQAAGREIFQRELEPTLQRLAATLQELQAVARRRTGPWESLLSHAAIATMAAVVAWLLAEWHQSG